MSNLDDALAEFMIAESHRRSSLVEELAEVADERVVSLFLEILRDTAEEDFVRVEVLKSLPFRQHTPTTREQFAHALVAILAQPEEDTLVRQFAAIAARRFVDEPGVALFLEELVCNAQEDLDVRHNALSSLERNSTNKECRECLQRIVNVPDFASSATRALQRTKTAES